MNRFFSDRRLGALALLSALMLGLTALTACDPLYIGDARPSTQGEGMEFVCDSTFYAYDGRWAGDSLNDVLGRDPYIYWEKNQFPYTLEINWQGGSVDISQDNDKIRCYTDGAHVVVDLRSGDVAGVAIVMRGQSDDASLKIYSRRNVKLVMDGVQLRSQRGPALNNQCKKRLFVHLSAGTDNRLEDAAQYQDDSWYLNGSSAATEDRKGCFFSEGHLVFSGYGRLKLQGNNRHAMASDATMYVRPGVTLVVEGAAKNAIHVKGDEDEAAGLSVLGGYIYAQVSQPGAKCIKTDQHFVMKGGELELYTTGAAVYDDEDLDTSSPACIKADGNVSLLGGRLCCKSKAAGAKAINANGVFRMDAGELQALTLGADYHCSDAAGGELHTYAHVLKADSGICITGGSLSLLAGGRDNQAAALKTDALLQVTGGDIYAYASDDALKARNISFEGGRSFVYSCNNEAIDAKNRLVMSGGLVLANACGIGQHSLSAASLFLDGARVIAVSNAFEIQPSSESRAAFKRFDCSADKNTVLALYTDKDVCLMAYTLPLGLGSMKVLMSHPDMDDACRLRQGTADKLGLSAEAWNGYFLF